MRVAKNAAPNSDRKPASSLSNKLIDAMRERVIPLATQLEPLPEYTRFAFTHEDVIDALIKDIRKDNPEIVQDRGFFISEVEAAYDRLLGVP
jgi:hypothetical protein